MNTNIFELKNTKKIKLKKEFSLSRSKTKALWLIKLKSKDLIIELRDWLLNLDAEFIIEIPWIDTEKLWTNIIATWKINKNDLVWFDFAIFDQLEVNISNYTNYWVTPIIKKGSHLSSLLIQFNPIKNSWNSFIYEKLNKWCIFAWIVKYLENYKFPYDNKNLVKRVVEI